MFELAEGWRTTTLAALGEYNNGFAFGEDQWSERGLPIVRIAQITGSQGITDRFEGQLSDAYRLADEDIIFSWSGTLAVVRWRGGPAWLNQHLFKVVPGPGVSGSFLYHLLAYCVAEMDKKSHGSTMKHIKRGELREFVVDLPRRETEQNKIAEVLDVLDSKIFRLQASFEKLKLVKQGLLHDLLTRGVDSNGELRPDAEQRPELYKPSLIGLIPKAMEATQLGEALTGIDAGWSPSCPEEPPSDGEWGVLKVSAITGGEFRASESKRLPPELRPDPGIEVRSGDVLLARANGVADLVGSTVFVQETRNRLMLSDKTLRLNAAPIKMRSMYLAAVMQAHRTKKQIGSMLNGSSGQKNISQQEIRRIIVAYPKPDEQRFVELQIRQIEDQILFERFELTKLNNLKVGLTEDLLTGRIRVTSLLEK